MATATASDVEIEARRLARRPWVERAARFGLAAKAFVYFAIGGLALLSALGAGGRTTDSQGALRELSRLAGRALLAPIAAGLVAYGAWRVLQAAGDLERKGRGWRGTLLRLGQAGKGLVHLALAATPVRLLMEEPVSRGGSLRRWTAELMAWDGGRWLVGVAAAAVLVAALAQLWRALAGTFEEHLATRGMSDRELAWARRAGVAGHLARGVSFGLIGAFLLQAALHADPAQARGLGEVLDTLREQPYGRWLLGTMAAGLCAYAAYVVVEARWRRVVGYR